MENLEEKGIPVSNYFDFSRLAFEYSVSYFVFKKMRSGFDWFIKDGRYISVTNLLRNALDSHKSCHIYSCLALESYFNLLFKSIPDEIKTDKCFDDFNGKGQNFKEKFKDIKRLLEGDHNVKIYNEIMNGLEDLKKIRNDVLIHDKGAFLSEYKPVEVKFIRNPIDCFFLLNRIHIYLNEANFF